jgi:hypothetical protein
MRLSRQFLAAVTAFALLALGSGRTAAGPVSAIYTFDNIPQGTQTTFSDTEGGVTATFFGDANTTATVVGNGFAAPFSGNILMSQGGHLGIDVTFSTPINKVSVDIGAVDSNPGYSFVGFAAYSGGVYGTPVGGAGLVFDTKDFQQQGVVTFSSATPFDSLVIQSSPSYYTWIDNVAIGAAAVPEPGGLSLGAVCLGALALRAWRRRQAAVLA